MIVAPFGTALEIASCLSDTSLVRQEARIQRILGGTMLDPLWDGFHEGLSVHGLYISAELRKRGYENEFEWFQGHRLQVRTRRARYTRFPEWLTDRDVQNYSRELLVWSDPETYLEVFPDVPEQFQRPEFDWSEKWLP